MEGYGNDSFLGTTTFFLRGVNARLRAGSALGLVWTVYIKHLVLIANKFCFRFRYRCSLA